MPVLNNVSCPDQYDPSGKVAAIQDIFPVPNGGGWFALQPNGNSAFCQLQYGTAQYGSGGWAEEQVLGSGAYGTIPPNATGIRFRNAVAGKQAVVTAVLNTKDTPTLGVSSLGTVNVVTGATLNFQHNDVFLSAEPTIDFEDGGVVWALVDDGPNTRVKVSASGKAPTQTLLTVGSGNYTPPAGCVAILAEIVAGGGAGGGTQAMASGQFGAAGGGGGGGYSISLIRNPVGPYAYVVGAGGTPATGAGGGTGGSSSFNGANTATGGTGGQTGFAETTPFLNIGGTGGSGGLGSGTPGIPGIALAAGQTNGGNGGANGKGGGGGQGSQNGVGAVGGAGGGGGGSGVQAGASGAQPGGAGGNGYILITEFY